MEPGYYRTDPQTVVKVDENQLTAIRFEMGEYSAHFHKPTERNFLKFCSPTITVTRITTTEYQKHFSGANADLFQLNQITK